MGPIQKRMARGGGVCDSCGEQLCRILLLVLVILFVLATIPYWVLLGTGKDSNGNRIISGADIGWAVGAAIMFLIIAAIGLTACLCKEKQMFWIRLFTIFMVVFVTRIEGCSQADVFYYAVVCAEKDAIYWSVSVISIIISAVGMVVGIILWRIWKKKEEGDDSGVRYDY